MSRLAVSNPVDRASRAGVRARRRTKQSVGTATRVASTDPLKKSLMGGLQRGWGLASLAGVAAQYRVAHGDRVAARLGASLLRAGIASAEAWAEANRDPHGFLLLALERWVALYGGTLLAENFYLTLTLCSTVDEFSNEESTDGRAYLIVDPSQCGYLVMGPALRALDIEHPRLPVTFYRLLLGAINRWARVFDYQDALERNERLREWYEGDPDAENIELPDIESAIPACLRRKALSTRGLRQLLPCIRSSQVRNWVEGVLVVHEESHSCSVPVMESAIREQLYDSNPPLPVLLTVFEKRDAIEGAFDAEAEGMLEVSPEPNLILPLQTEDAIQVRSTFATLRCFCRTLALANQLMKQLPGNAG